MSKKCTCPTPPGGGIDCPPDNLAICRSANGKCRGYCKAIPKELTLEESLNWQINMIKGENRPLSQELLPEDYDFLQSGEYSFFSRDENEVVITFSVPDIGLRFG